MILKAAIGDDLKSGGYVMESIHASIGVFCKKIPIVKLF